ncbi:MAG: S26 family signal peptidase [Myxococcales bacterium]|nr:S26 family signal peptidase [Myxococcales bacterium]
MSWFRDRTWAVFLGVVLVVALLRGSVLGLVDVADEGLAPELLAGDQVVVDRTAYGLQLLGEQVWSWADPAPGDVVLFAGERGLRLSRVAATPGERVRVEGDRLVADDVPRILLGEGQPAVSVDVDCQELPVVAHALDTHTLWLDAASATLPRLAEQTLADDEALVLLDNLSSLDGTYPALEVVSTDRLRGVVRFVAFSWDPCAAASRGRTGTVIGPRGRAMGFAFPVLTVSLLLVLACLYVLYERARRPAEDWVPDLED